MGYIVCEECGDYYKLQPGEQSEDFSNCHCGGELKYELFMNQDTHNIPSFKSNFKLPSFSKINSETTLRILKTILKISLKIILVILETILRICLEIFSIIIEGLYYLFRRGGGLNF